MRQIKEYDERRNEILNSAEALFHSKGYSKCTVNDILKEVSIAKGTFYYYFKSKEEVMDAIVMRFIDNGIENIEAIAQNKNLNAKEKLFQIIMFKSPDIPQKEPILEQFHQASNAEMHQKSLVQSILRLTPILTDVVEQGIEEGNFNTPYPKEVVEFLLVSSQFLFDEGIFSWTQEEILKKSQALVYITEASLGAEKGSFDYIMHSYEETEKE